MSLQPPFLRRRIVISKSRSLAETARITFRPVAHLTFDAEENRQRAIPFLRAAHDPNLWPPGREAALGRSVVAGTHAVTAEAIAEIAARRTGKQVVNRPATTEGVRKDGEALADWIVNMAGIPQQDSLSEKELLYFVISGADRARAIAIALGGLRGMRPIADVVDSGTGIGMIPWLLRTEFPEMRSARLIEPEKRYIDPLERLWMTCGDALQYRVERTSAEKAQYRESNTDLAMFCQCLFRIQPHLRAEVLARAWRALRRGGVLLVNEALRDEGTPEPERAGQVLKDDLIDMMPRNVRLFRYKTGWRRAEDLRRVPARDIAYSGLMVAVRD